MNKLFLTILPLILIGAVPQVLGQPSHINWDLCNDGKCFFEVPSLQQTPYTFPPFLTSTNKQMDIFLPDGSCNLNGKMQSDGSCNTNSVILTFDNYTRLKNNVAYMAVVNIKDINAGENIPYCKLAQSIWNGQTNTYQHKLQNVTQFVVPDNCMQELGSLYHVPEFGLVSALILGIATIYTVIFTTKTRGTPIL